LFKKANPVVSSSFAGVSKLFAVLSSCFFETTGKNSKAELSKKQLEKARRKVKKTTFTHQLLLWQQT
jgi:hypothetical protein